jgi:hypothetical protein
MSSVPPSQVGDASRVALARLALDVVSTIPGVAGTDAGPSGLCVTADSPFGVLRGVSVIAQPDGRYEIDLCLVARMVPLLALGDDIRRRLRARAAREGLADQLGAVNVEFAQALSAGETIVQVPGVEAAVGAEAVPPAPPPPAEPPPTTPPGPSAVPEEPTDSIGSQTPSPDAGSLPDPPSGSTARTPPPESEPRT